MRMIKQGILAICCFLSIIPAQAQHVKEKNCKGYLFAYFTGNRKEQESIHFALSKNGYSFTALNNNRPIMSSLNISETGGVRDPHIVRGSDGKSYYMVVTDMVSSLGWNSNRGLVLMRSDDLIHWTSKAINIQKRFPGNDSLLRVWAPQTIYDPSVKKYMVYFSMKHGVGPDIIYYAYANKDFTDLEAAPKQLFYHPENKSCIDGDIVWANGEYHLFFKTEGHGDGIKKAVSKTLTGGYVVKEDRYVQQTKEAVEGAGTFKLNGKQEWILMYDVYKKGGYQFTKTTDLINFKAIDDSIRMDFHPRHGTVMSITTEEEKRLLAEWGPEARRRAAVKNPVLQGSFADPFVLYSENTKKYYIYPTSDGFNEWSGNYFKTFSSIDLVNWKDEGIILDLTKQVKWANRNAWAPTIIERKIDGKYKYFYYFCAAQQIGVAVANHPTGPFVDLGKPLIDQRPPGINRGQQIDPDVFKDPVSGKYFLYWGNGYLAAAELNDDMVSLKQETFTILTPDATFREGVHVTYRQGKYYVQWSENDTRDADYRVRYGISETPLGKIMKPANNLLLAKDSTAGIYGTGHHSILQIPGKDEWYIVYHRFRYPDGINLGRAAGYNREVCIDPLYFKENGEMERVVPSHRGVISH